MVSDPIGDMLTRIRNGLQMSRSSVTSPASKARENVLAVLKEEGYIREYSTYKADSGFNEIKIELKYRDEEPVIKELSRVSRPGRRVYASVNNLPRVYNGLGISILSTSRGVVSDSQAREQNVGGEVICSVF